jgi:hypothetical protein
MEIGLYNSEKVEFEQGKVVHLQNVILDINSKTQDLEQEKTNKIAAIVALAIPLLRYSFGVINWRLEEIKKLTGKLGICWPCIICITLKLT